MKNLSFLILLHWCLVLNAQKTHFQTAGKWHPELNFTTDAVIVYGSPETFIENSSSWSDKNFEIQSMMSSSWGHSGFFNELGFNILKENPYAQKDEKGNIIKHGDHEFYIVPDSIFTNYLKENISIIIDNGATAIYLEEPEYFNYTGYSDVFKKKWKEVYSQPWQNQYTSPTSYYYSSLLKSDFYFQHLKKLARHIKLYSKGKVKCYIPTHSILNYSLWQIISPENLLNTVDDIDGYIGQVWTGTARTPIYYNGIYKERTFENAYLEYSSLRSMAKAGGKEIFFLTDPIEDDPEHTWDDYRENYHKTFVAQMLFSDVDKYEVMPWPDRIFFEKYNNGNGLKSKISNDYATELSILINAMQNIKSSNYESSTVGVMLSRTLMYQSNYNKEGYEDKRSSNFYGLVLPLVKNGIHPNIVFLEQFSNSIKNSKILLMTYENMKPLSKEIHNEIAEWVNNGGTLLFFGKNNNVFNSINQWWNKEGYNFPAEHLFEILRVKNTNELQKVGKGNFLYFNENPEEFVLKKDGQNTLLTSLEEIYNLIDEPLWVVKNYFEENRGPYKILSVMDESITNEPYKIKGCFVDLFDAFLPVIKELQTNVNEVNFVYDINKIPKDTFFEIIASSSKVLETKKTKNTYKLKLKGATSALNVTRFYAKNKIRKVLLNGEKIKLEPSLNNTYLLSFEGNKNINNLEIFFE
jgi:hypothetical protein